MSGIGGQGQSDAAVHCHRCRAERRRGGGVEMCREEKKGERSFWRRWVGFELQDLNSTLYGNKDETTRSEEERGFWRRGVGFAGKLSSLDLSTVCTVWKCDQCEMRKGDTSMRMRQRRSRGKFAGNRSLCLQSFPHTTNIRCKTVILCSEVQLNSSRKHWSAGTGLCLKNLKPPSQLNSSRNAS